MKNLPFLIILISIFLLFLIFLSSYPLICLSTYLPIAHAQTITRPQRLAASMAGVAVTAFVDEHLGYQTDGGKLIISTNSPLGFSLITSQKTIQFFQPTEQTFDLFQNSFLLVTNF